jgi:hypothetical protein
MARGTLTRPILEAGASMVGWATLNSWTTNKTTTHSRQPETSVLIFIKLPFPEIYSD